MRPVVVHIDSLVLKGIRYEDRHAVSAGLQEELARLLGGPGMTQQLAKTGEIPRLRVGDIRIAADAKPRQIGIAAAQGINKGWTR